MGSDYMVDSTFDVVVIGGGAAGFFTAIRLKEINPNMRVTIVEKTNKLLSKVRVSGGGRCNVTHDCRKNSELLLHYPRGKRILKEAFNQWNVTKTINWFQEHGVQLKTESDGRMFPITDNSETIAGLFEWLTHRYQIPIFKGLDLKSIEKSNSHDSWRCNFLNKENNSSIIESKFVVLALGGQQQVSHYSLLQQLDTSYENPVPSLFTFQIQDKKLLGLAGVSVNNGNVKLVGFEPAFQGPILVTHWGLSGPAVLKTSAWAAKWLFEKQYHTSVLVGWLGVSENEFRTIFNQQIELNAKKNIGNLPLPWEIPGRVWDFILEKSEVFSQKKCMELTKLEKNRILENTLRMPFEIKGKTTFKEEFVTAGGADDLGVNIKTLELQNQKNIFVAGEYLNVDGVTGGFNFQAAWSSANLVANSIMKKMNVAIA